MEIIGIDPAFREKGIGFARLDTKTKIVTFEKYSITELLKAIYQRQYSNCYVCVENSNLQNASFFYKGNVKVVARMARNVGANQATSQIICDALQFNCLKVLGISPKSKGKKIESTNLIQGIARQKGWELSKKRLSQDDRDAFMLMSIFHSKLKIKC
jgi:hypothetical protein